MEATQPSRRFANSRDILYYIVYLGVLVVPATVLTEVFQIYGSARFAWTAGLVLPGVLVWEVWYRSRLRSTQ